MVGNVLTDAMLDFVWEALTERLSTLKVDQGSYAMTIKKVTRTGWKTKLMVEAEIRQNDHQVIRQFAIDLMPG